MFILTALSKMRVRGFKPGLLGFRTFAFGPDGESIELCPLCIVCVRGLVLIF